MYTGVEDVKIVIPSRSLRKEVSFLAEDQWSVRTSPMEYQTPKKIVSQASEVYIWRERERERTFHITRYVYRSGCGASSVRMSGWEP